MPRYVIDIEVTLSLSLSLNALLIKILLLLVSVTWLRIVKLTILMMLRSLSTS